MQVSIYLNSDLLGKVAQRAKQAGQSRSQFIQSILKSVLFKRDKKTIFDKMCGTWSRETAEEMLKTIYENRQNSPRFA